MMGMEQDWKAQRTEAARVGLVAQFDQARRVTALESAIKYEIEAADRMRAQMMAAIECASVERAEHADTLAARDRTIAQQAATVGLLRAELDSAMRTIDRWSANRAPALTIGLRRCEASFCGVEFVCDYAVTETEDQHGDPCDVADLRAAWIGAVDMSAALHDECWDFLEQECQQALEDWCADEAEELAVAGSPSLREAAGVL